MAVRPKPVVVVPGAAVAGVYNAGEMPETVMVQFARNFVVDLANYTPASAEKGYLSAARFMSPELLSRFEPVAREQLKQVVTNRVSQFFTVDSYRVRRQGSARGVRFPRRTDNLRRKDRDREKTLSVSTHSPICGKNSAEPIWVGGKLG